MAVLFRRDDDRWFLRCFPGYATEAGARAAAKALWLEGYAVRVEARGGRWDVWRGI